MLLGTIDIIIIYCHFQEDTYQIINMKTKMNKSISYRSIDHNNYFLGNCIKNSDNCRGAKDISAIYEKLNIFLFIKTFTFIFYFIYIYAYFFKNFLIS